MTVKVNTTLWIKAVETQESDAVGRPMVTIPHAIGSAQGIANEDFYAVWSQDLDVPVGAPVILDVASLDFPKRAGAQDLYTGQELGVVALRTGEGGVVNVNFKTQGGDSLMIATMLPNKSHFQHVHAGHILAQPVKTIEFMALTGAGVVAVLLASRERPE